ncbi:MAG: NAD(P)H-hydrate epimerase, partial [Pikeienuella sp.]
MELLTAAEMRAAERAAIGSGAASGLDLMERAGEGVVAAALDRAPALARAPGWAAILCGPGNNGGDGFVIARVLRARGWRVDLFQDPGEGAPPDAAENLRRWRGIGAIRPLAEAGGALDADLIIDALFGTGLTRPLEGEAARLAALSRGARARIVAVDAPSGLCCDSGRALGAAFHAGLTVTFHRAKRGHYLDEGPFHCGDLDIVDIGLSGAAPGAARLAGPPGGGIDKAGGHKY